MQEVAGAVRTQLGHIDFLLNNAGKPMPKGVTWDEDWDRMLEFRYQTSARFERELRDHVRARNPKATVDFNYHGSPPFSLEVG